MTEMFTALRFEIVCERNAAELTCAIQYQKHVKFVEEFFCIKELLCEYF